METAGQIGYDLLIGVVKPKIELNKMYYCDIIYERDYSSKARYYYTGAITRVEEATNNIINEQPKEEPHEPTTNIISEQPEPK